MSGYTLIAARGLSPAPLDAAADCHARIVPLVRAALADGDAVLAFDVADHAHAGWRLALVQALAREAAPRRVNAVAGPAAQCGPLIEYLARAPGVTGQVLLADGNPAEKD